MIVDKSDEQISSLLDDCNESRETGVSKFPGMSYEEGILAVLEWLDCGVDHPLDS